MRSEAMIRSAGTGSPPRGRRSLPSPLTRPPPRRALPRGPGGRHRPHPRPSLRREPGRLPRPGTVAEDDGVGLDVVVAGGADADEALALPEAVDHLGAGAELA